MHNTLCETFRLLAFRTFDQIGRARRVGHQPLEETFTDINILELKDRHSTEVFSHNFSKHQEGINGADWEWWFTDVAKSKWLGVRVQAKILHLGSNTFSHLHYKSGKAKTYQLSKLKRECQKDGLVPLYCFYLYSQPKFLNSISRCRTFGHVSESYGCSITSLAHIELLQKNGKNDLASVIQGAYPWHCLVCCSGYGGYTLPERVWKLLTSGMGIVTHRRRTRTENQIEKPVMGVRDKPPQYVRDILNKQNPEQSVNVNYVVVVVESEQS